MFSGGWFKSAWLPDCAAIATDPQLPHYVLFPSYQGSGTAACKSLPHVERGRGEGWLGNGRGSLELQHVYIKVLSSGLYNEPDAPSRLAVNASKANSRLAHGIHYLHVPYALCAATAPWKVNKLYPPPSSILISLFSSLVGPVVHWSPEWAGATPPERRVKYFGYWRVGLFLIHLSHQQAIIGLWPFKTQSEIERPAPWKSLIDSRVMEKGGGWEGERKEEPMRERKEMESSEASPTVPWAPVKAALMWIFLGRQGRQSRNQDVVYRFPPASADNGIQKRTPRLRMHQRVLDFISQNVLMSALL